MILSHRYRCIYIKTYKTASTSLELYLGRYCAPEDIVTVIHNHPRDEQADLSGHQPRNHGDRFYNHMPASQVRDLVPANVWDSYFKFTVDRNPWDKTLSHYHMMSARYGPYSLEEYLERGEFCLNYPFYTDPGGGGLIVDRVLRYEDLDRELAGVFSRLGVPYGGGLGIRARSGNRTDRRPYREVYTTPQRRLIERVFAPEIALHGYRY